MAQEVEHWHFVRLNESTRFDSPDLNFSWNTYLLQRKRPWTIFRFISYCSKRETIADFFCFKFDAINKMTIKTFSKFIGSVLNKHSRETYFAGTLDIWTKSKTHVSCTELIGETEM